MDLIEFREGNFGYVYWLEKTKYEMSEDEIQKLRQKGISDTLNATLLNHIHEPGKSIRDMDTVIQRGWTEANKQKNIIENGTEIKREMFLIGDPNTPSRIREIQSSTEFRGWSNPYIIEEILKNAE